MKIIVTGATGFVGKEVIRQALRNPAITSVVALARKPVSWPDNSGSGEDISKFQSVVLNDWATPYPEYIKEQLKGADACIWTLAVTPTKSRSMDFAEVTEVCSDYTINGLTSIATVANKPFRFIYTSGVLIERDQTKLLTGLPEYRLMRGRVENHILDFAKNRHPDVEATVTKPGAIDGPGRAASNEAVVKALFDRFGYSPRVHVSELAAAMIDQCVNGITKDPLWSDDLATIGKRVLREEDYLA